MCWEEEPWLANPLPGPRLYRLPHGSGTLKVESNFEFRYVHAKLCAREKLLVSRSSDSVYRGRVDSGLRKIRIPTGSFI